MANTSGKAYGLTAITRMHPLKTWGVRLVFALIQISLRPPAVRGAVGGMMFAAAIVTILGLLQLLGLPVRGATALGTRLVEPGLGAWAVGLVMVLAAFAALGAAIGAVYQPKWTILGRITQVQENLTELSFIHFARWVIIGRNAFPRLRDDQPRENLRYDYFFFESNFNGDWQKYIDAFSQVVPGGMDNIWRWSVKYPGSRPISPFLAYIRGCQYDTDHYYSAYPGAATNDILGALRLEEELKRFQAQAATLTPAGFGQAWDALLVRVQNCLARTGPPPVAVPTGGGSNGRMGGTHG